MTITLLLNSEGKKMGKTANGAVWLDPEKTSPYEFYQYWRNVDDADVINCIKMLTFLPLEEIKSMESWEGAELNKAKEILAYQLTELVHGKEEADKAETAAKSIFGGGGSENMPETVLTEEDFKDGKIDAISILVKAELVPSMGEGRRAIEQNGVAVNGEKVTDIHTQYDKNTFESEFVIRRGKKNFRKIVLG